MSLVPAAHRVAPPLINRRVKKCDGEAHLLVRRGFLVEGHAEGLVVAEMSFEV